MTALTSDRNTPLQDASIVSAPVAANAVIYAGALVVANSTGFAAPGSASVGVQYIGRAEESVNNTGGANGAKQVSIRRLRAFKWANDGTVNQAAYMLPAYIVDDQTVSATDGTGTRSIAGKIVAIDTDGVWVE